MIPENGRAAADTPPGTFPSILCLLGSSVILMTASNSLSLGKGRHEGTKYRMEGTPGGVRVHLGRGGKKVIPEISNRWLWDYLRDKLLRRVLRPASVSKQEFSRAETLRWSFIWRLHPMGYFSPVTSVSMGCSIPYASSRRRNPVDLNSMVTGLQE